MGSGNQMQRGDFLMKRGGLWLVVFLWFWRTGEGDKDRFKMGKSPEGRDPVNDNDNRPSDDSALPQNYCYRSRGVAS